MNKLDHIVIGAFTLEEGTEFVESKLQSKLSDIGYHENLGTHNRVIRIDDNVYLEVIAINPQSRNLKVRNCFNLDNSTLQSKLKKSPQIISYVIENNDINILKYYDPFFEVSRANYRWQFAMPSYKKNILNDDIIESGIIPSLISWKSENPILHMKKNQFELIGFEIILSKKEHYFKSILNSFGEIKNVTFISSMLENTPFFKLKLKDNLRNTIISF